MGYSLTLAEDLATAVRRAARDQLEPAAEGLATAGDAGVAEAVHDARKRVKKTRALLRLVRRELPAREFKSRNRELRDRGRALSGARDADAMAETLERLAQRFAGQAPASVFDGVHERLLADAQRSRAALTGGHVREQAAAFRTLAAGAEEWGVEDAGAGALAKALRRTYARGRAEFARADREPTDVHLHDWRKRVKDLWYQERLLRSFWPELMEAQAGEAKALSKLLGDDHDLAVLTIALRDDASLLARTLEPDLLLELIARRRAELLADSRRLGRLVYAEPPKAFGRRMLRYARAVAADRRAAAA